MSERPYLSIGEVLGLLLEEFPDVTISKIRFLESQGLIDPERTPSGYRKFYDHDVERLRVILREQRENYLPLRVIRDRLQRGDIDADASGGQPTPRGVRNVEVPAASVAGHPAAAGLAAAAGAGTSVATASAQATAGNSATAPTAGSSPRPEATPANSGAGSGDDGGERTGQLIRPATAAPSPAPRPAQTPSRQSGAAPAPAQRGSASRRSNGITGDSVTREELCAIAGLSAEQLSDLESYGILSGRGSGMSTVYGGLECEIATLAARFLARGMDARHLRAWKTSADREAGLFEQRILPLLRQRNPQARQHALDMLHELADLGGELRSAMVRAAVRHLE